MNYLRPISVHLKTKVKFQTIQRTSPSSIKRTPLRRRSKKGAALDRQYNKRVKVWKIENPQCLVCYKANTKDCHHMKGRGKWLMVEEFWLPTCRSCHREVEENPGWAREKGYSI